MLHPLCEVDLILGLEGSISSPRHLPSLGRTMYLTDLALLCPLCIPFRYTATVGRLLSNDNQR